MASRLSLSGTINTAVVHTLDLVINPIEGLNENDEVVITLNGRVLKRMNAHQASAMFSLDTGFSSELDPTRW